MSKEQVLNMLESGTITADEAARLLDALAAGKGTPGGEHAASQDPSPEPRPVEPDQVILDTFRPDARHWDRVRQIPFAISIALLCLSGWGLYALRPQGDRGITFGWVLVLILFLLSALGLAATFWMLRAPWLHVRIEERDGKRIAISLPLPLALANWGLWIARRFVDDHTAQYLDMSSEFIGTMRKNRGGQAEPIIVDVDEDGQHVQVYLG